tara:strand:+ start:138 stop:1031 length:894 start_codon:yes stop_codon:yes gene_type:complete
MAIAGSIIKGTSKIIGKAIKGAKKKKKKIGDQLKKEGKFIKEKVTGPAKQRLKNLEQAKSQPQNIKGMPLPKRDKLKGVKNPIRAQKNTLYSGGKPTTAEKLDAVSNTKAFTKGQKAFTGTKKKVTETLGKAAKSPAGIAATESLKDINKATGGFVSGKNIAAVAGVAGGLGLAQSVIKSTAKPEQEYTQKRLGDGRISTTYGGKNGNAVFSEKLLTQKEVDEVRTQLAILESIVLSDNPRKQRDQFINTVLLLNNKYGINNITGKNLSIIMPPVGKGQKKKLNIAQSGNMSKNFFR